ncbi:MAG: YkgJ family cysteine cluster protein [Deltaproteobacteria bacterium]|nr:YkgJ family cysteine cluster protein [Deltaproteobacteria bacterium]
MKAFVCKMCGTCCYGEGGIRLEDREIKAISRFLEITAEEFAARYCETRNSRLYIKTGKDNYCIFYDHAKQCLIHPVHPLPCKQWPFYAALLRDRETWRQAQEACPGINPDCPHEEFVRQAPEPSK